MFENPGSKKQHKKIKTVSAATENIGNLLIQSYWGKLSLHFYHRPHTQKREEFRLSYTAQREGEGETLAGVKHQVKRGLGSTTCFWSSSRRRKSYLAGFGSPEEKHSFDSILHSENNRGWFCVSCDTWTSATTVCHWSQVYLLSSESLWQQGQ